MNVSSFTLRKIKLLIMTGLFQFWNPQIFPLTLPPFCSSLIFQFCLCMTCNEIIFFYLLPLFFSFPCWLMDNSSFYNYLVTVHTKRGKWNRCYSCTYTDHCTRNICWIRAVVYVAWHCVSRKRDKIANSCCLFCWHSVPAIVALRMLWNIFLSDFFKYLFMGPVVYETV